MKFVPNHLDREVDVFVSDHRTERQRLSSADSDEMFVTW